MVFLIKQGEELIVSTEKFMHEQRVLGHEGLLKNLEQNTIDLENILIELKARLNYNLEDEKQLHEVHEINQELLVLIDLIEEQKLAVKKNAEHLSTLKPGETTIHKTTLTSVNSSDSTTHPTTSK